MNFSQEKAMFHLTGQTYHDAVTLATVQQVTEEYPYFAPAQCLLAYQFKKEEHPMVVLQTLKTALYFTNPYWLQYQLQDDGLARPKKRAVAETPPVIETPVMEEPAPITENKVQEEPAASAEAAQEPSYDIRSVIAGAEPTEEHQTQAEPVVSFGPEPLLKAVPEERPTPPADTFPEGEPPLPATSLLAADMAIPTVEAVKEMMRRIDPVTEAEQEANATLPAEEPAEEEPAMEEAGLEAGNKISSLLSEQLADFKKPLEEDAKLEIEITEEKLHTVDYFASQGIKIDLAAVPQDKLTNHLRKFTDWLKQVKQGELNAKDLVANIEMEQQVAKTALHSNETDDIITEAMAEVLEKQGQLDKAIEVYHKLSFINPEKSSYFAAKIEHLKGI